MSIILNPVSIVLDICLDWCIVDTESRDGKGGKMTNATALRRWEHPKTGEIRVYFNTPRLGRDVKIWWTKEADESIARAGMTSEYHERVDNPMNVSSGGLTVADFLASLVEDAASFLKFDPSNWDSILAVAN